MRGPRILWDNQRGQDIAEYALMFAVILVLVVGTIRLVGSNANTVFSQVASAVRPGHAYRKCLPSICRGTAYILQQLQGKRASIFIEAM